MKLSLRPTTIHDLHDVREFLQRAFDSEDDAPFLDPALMRWKYWDPRGDWEEPRSYVLEQDGAIVAHAGIFPVSFNAGTVRGVHLIDWASSKQVPGAGRGLLQRLGTMFDFMYAVGGNARSRRILPTLGFAKYTKAWNYARPLRPLQQILTHPNRDWKLAPRLLRNFVWSAPKAAGDRSSPGWKAERIDPEAVSEEFYLGDMTKSRFSPRPPAFFEYILRCPALPMHLFGIADDRGPQGHFAIGVMRGQALVGGVWLRDPDKEAWCAAFSLAQQVAMEIEEANEIAISGTAGTSEQGAAQAGLHNVEYTPVYLLNKKGKLMLPADFQFQLCDSDAFFLDLGHSAYWT
jgi:hypothetical protein